MANRLLEVVVSKENEQEACDIIRKHIEDKILTSFVGEDLVSIRLVIHSAESGDVMKELETTFGSFESFRMLVFPLEASVPRIEEPEEEKEEETKEEDAPRFKILGVSIDELYADVTEAVGTVRNSAIMVILASIVAAVGLARSNVAVIIGAMVIAPFLGPNVAVSLGTVLGDFKLAIKAAKQLSITLVLGVAVSILIGMLFSIDHTVHEIASRTHVDMADIALALSSGVVGAFAFTSAALSSLIGVMVAVALLPPLAVFGMLLGSAHFSASLGALILFIVNIVCVNLAGVVTFRVFGVKPKVWWKEESARTGTRNAMILWGTLLAVLCLIILLGYI